MEEIKAGDIMIGNYVMFENTIHIVTEISETLVATRWIKGNDKYIHELSDLVPIPLTEGILLKAGFEKENEDDKYGRVFLIPNTKYIIRIVNYGNPQKVDFGYSLEISDNKNWSDIKRIYFIHELQNLFYCLCGEEITIKLD